MPKQTFFNLPESKRQTLIDAAKREFSRAPIYEASISNIVKSAGIPRGSFYQYFEDKEDAFIYLLEELAAKRQRNFALILKSYKGDLFDAMMEMYQMMLKGLPSQENRSFLKNAFLNMTHRTEKTISIIFSDNENNEHLKKVSLQIDREKLNVTNDREMYHAMQIITAVTFRNFVEKFAKELSDEEAVNNYTIEMNFLKNGLYKKGHK